MLGNTIFGGAQKILSDGKMTKLVVINAKNNSSKTWREILEEKWLNSELLFYFEI